jgi:hypothetical protein
MFKNYNLIRSEIKAGQPLSSSAGVSRAGFSALNPIGLISGVKDRQLLSNFIDKKIGT